MEDEMKITPLGSGQEVGRSCHVVKFRGITVMLDIGIHPGIEGIGGLPFIDSIDPSEIDVLLVTHFHLDHVASLPFLTEKTSFKGRIFMTHPTRAVTRLLLTDYLRLLSNRNASEEDILYNEKDLENSMNKIEVIDFHTTMAPDELPGLSFYALNAGHVLGACMFWINIGGRSLLYTGDYSMEDDRHLMAAELPAGKPDVLVCESTFGVQVHASRAEREARFTGMIERVVTRGGRCLIPVFALGRAQELLLILDEYWQANPQLQNIPVWYASKMANRALRVYQTYSNMMNHRIRASMDVGNPFHFTYIQNLKSIDATSFPDTGPSVVFASPGMLQSGVSRQLFDRWAADAKNGVMIAGYAVEHTLAKEIMNQPKEVVTLEGKRQPLNCLVDYVSFAAHVDFVQNRGFIQKVDPRHIILVHGQKDEMGRLKSALNHYYRTLPENKRPTISMPPNAQDVTYKFARRRSAKVMGSLVEPKKEPKEGDEVQGILVTQNFTSKIVRADELATYTPLRVGSVSSRLHIPYIGAMETLKLMLTEVFQGVAVTETTTSTKFSLYENRVTLTFDGEKKGTGVLEWDASPASDTVADAIICLAMQAQTSNAAIRLTSKPCRHPRDNGDDENDKGKTDGDHDDENDGDRPSKKKARGDKGESLTESKLRFLKHTLKDQFADVEAVYEGNSATYEIQTDTGLDSGIVHEDNGDEEGGLTCTVRVTFDDDTGGLASVKTECIDQKLAKNVQTCITNIATLMNPLKIPE
eukprot:CAMPEP_0113448926 /NCGR_PEP_ID=MMETSP0014_2-20120614/5025_1 /TAXON_ID=2857 /ORGANISM="Nitzschia sp." /LENGTH=754 /DNA_ID=CAMNT_0000340167 /DNA_START=23 /DNA_END=2287 /DNA_ORIENTATION=+ /assembly_acc=CAM_ASM_000159